MKLNELQIGDFVKHKELNKIVTVEELRRDNTVVLSDGLQASVENIEPIPLTVEILEKNFTNIVANTNEVSFTESETDDLKIGSYVYTLDWYKNGVFQYCLVNNAKLKVEDKA